MVFYITKYALTKGIFPVDTDSLRSYSTENGRLVYTEKDHTFCAFSAGEWYTEKNMAILDAEQRRKRKIASLQAQIAKLEQLSFQPDALS